MSGQGGHVSAAELARRIRIAVWGLVATLVLASCTFGTWVEVRGESWSFWEMSLEGAVPIGPRLLPYSMLAGLILGVATSAEAGRRLANATWIVGLVNLVLLLWLLLAPGDLAEPQSAALGAPVFFVLFVVFFARVAWVASRDDRPAGREKWMDPDFGTVDRPPRKV
jgi:hypothetical protein